MGSVGCVSDDSDAGRSAGRNGESPITSLVTPSPMPTPKPEWLTPAPTDQPIFDFETMLKHVPAYRIQIFGDNVSLARPPNWVVIFLDPLCAYCNTFYWETLPLITKALRKHGGVLLYSHFLTASEFIDLYTPVVALECAGIVGGKNVFWAFLDQQRRSGTEYERLLEFARDLNIDERAFSNCLKDPQVRNAIDEEVGRAFQVYGLYGSPAFVINGRLFYGPYFSADDANIWR